MAIQERSLAALLTSTVSVCTVMACGPTPDHKRLIYSEHSASTVLDSSSSAGSTEWTTPDTDTVDTDDTPPTDTAHSPTADTGSTPTTTDTAAPTPPAVETRSTPLPACTDPSARETLGVFETRDLPGERADIWITSFGGVALAQLDADPELELIRTAVEGLQYYDLQEDGAWRDLAATHFPPEVEGKPSSVSSADFDGDGHRDLFIGYDRGTNRLLRNLGDGSFEDVSAHSGIKGPAWTTQCGAWSDWDLDGDLDLAVGNYGDLVVVDVEFERYHPSELYENLGDGTFANISHLIPEDIQNGWVFMFGWYDVDRDGRPDLYAVLDYPVIQPSQLLLNRGGEFVADPASGFHPGFFGMGLAVADLNGDGIPDTSESGFYRVSIMKSSPSTKSLSGVQYIEYAEAMGIELLHPMIGTDPRQNYGWGMAFADLDNDLDEDLVVAFGDLATRETDDPAYVPRAPHPDGYWEYEDDMLIERAAALGFDDDRGARGLAAADWDRDGWVDIATATLDGPTIVQHARCGTSRAAIVQLVDETTPMNRDAIGAEVVAVVGETRMRRYIDAGSTSMFSSEPPEASYGLGDAERIDALEVLWPDGEVTVHEDLPGHHLIVVTRHARAE